MPIWLGIAILIIVIVIIIVTRKTRKEYNQQEVRYYIGIVFKKLPIGLQENQKLKEIGYWYHDGETTFRVDSKIKKEELATLIIEQLNITKDDFIIRETTDLFVSQGRL